MSRKFLAGLLIAAALSIAPLSLRAAEQGWFGFALSIDADGILNPKLRSIKIDKIFPASPAATAGLTAGDTILEMEGIVVDGAKAETLKAAIQKSVGETLRLKIKHGADAPHDVSLIAAPKPAS
ncbi:MAG TPA: PDZ domain-containing protein [Steroidobacteraceae bacterium]|nr:PDZ domain-containing protein [Steroidobacteraceae bacterium]